MNNIEEFINKKMKFMNKHIDKCNEKHCLTCNRFYIKLDVYEELIFEITKIGKLNE